MNSEEVMNRIRKLMAMGASGSGASENEVEQALRHARRLMNEFNISEEQIAPAGAERITIEDHVAMTRMTFDHWEQRLALVPTHVCDVQAYIHHAVKDRSVHFVGFPRDVAIAKELYASLMVTCRTMAKARCGPGWTAKHRSYCVGFIDGIVEKVREEKEAASAAAGAIILRKGDLITKWFTDNGYSLRKGESSGTTIDRAAYATGKTDGRASDYGVTNRLKGAAS